MNRYKKCGKVIVFNSFTDEEVSWTLQVLELINSEGDISLLGKLINLNRCRGKNLYGDCEVIYGLTNIRINKTLNQDESTFKNTLMHELIHAFSNVPRGHGSLWKHYANKYSKILGTNITRVS